MANPKTDKILDTYLACIYCKSLKIKKNWFTATWAQRYKCLECWANYSHWGVRWSFDPDFREKSVTLFCHWHLTAREAVKEYGISSATLIDWAKKHRERCEICQWKKVEKEVKKQKLIKTMLHKWNK